MKNDKVNQEKVVVVVLVVVLVAVKGLMIVALLENGKVHYEN